MPRTRRLISNRGDRTVPASALSFTRRLCPAPESICRLDKEGPAPLSIFYADLTKYRSVLVEAKAMLDVIFIVAGVGFFILSAGYVALCDQL
jgi:hypothetical protein